MNLDRLVSQLGEWLRGTGPEVDVVISTRIRLARNLAGFPFISKASTAKKAEIEAKVRQAVEVARIEPRLHFVSVEPLEPLDRTLLVERQLISRELANASHPRGVAFDDRESVSVMVNEEDHLRLQVLRSGLALDETWQMMNQVDDALEDSLTYAFHEQFGYLTACPTNVGTGMRASVMLHLPALGITKQLEKVFKALQSMNLVVRGLYGEGSRASGDLYQISNQITLGRSESRLLMDITDVIQMIVTYERQARQVLLQERKQAEKDRAARAVEGLANALMLTSEDTMELLSTVRLAVHLNLIEDIPPALLNQLFIQTQSAHLQKLMGSPLDPEERNAARARFLRSKLRELGTL